MCTQYYIRLGYSCIVYCTRLHYYWVRAAGGCALRGRAGWAAVPGLYANGSRYLGRWPGICTCIIRYDYVTLQTCPDSSTLLAA